LIAQSAPPERRQLAATARLQFSLECAPIGARKLSDKISLINIHIACLSSRTSGPHLSTGLLLSGRFSHASRLLSACFLLASLKLRASASTPQFVFASSSLIK